MQRSNLMRQIRMGLLGASLMIGGTVLPTGAFGAEEGAPKPEGRPGAARGERGQGQRNPAEMLERFEAALKDLQLSDEQKGKVKEAFEKAKTALQSARDSGAREGIMKAMGELRETVMGALSEEQRKALQEKLPAGGGPGGPGARAGGAMGGLQKAAEAALEKLSLSDDQKAKIKALNSEMEKKMREMMSGGDREGMRDKFRAMMEERRTKMGEILSPEQREKFEAAMKEAMEKMRGEGGQRRPNARPDGDKPKESK